jgi:Universal stress protein UspA and related nucleotide-binding proteins
MNTIIIPIDFSPGSENAMHYGAQLAGELNASVVLVHIYQVPITMNDMPVMIFSADESKNSADTGLERCREELQQNYPELTIATESRLGSVAEEVHLIAKEKNPLAIVMGSQHTRGLERMLFGSTTASVIRHAHYPVFAIPLGFKKTAIKNIVLAADLEDTPVPLCHKIIELVQLLGASLHIVHVKIKEEAERPEKLLEKMSTLSPFYHSIDNKKVKDGLEKYVQEVNADLLIFLPHEHNLIERMFFKVHTEDIITNTRIPALAIKA